MANSTISKARAVLLGLPHGVIAGSCTTQSLQQTVLIEPLFRCAQLGDLFVRRLLPVFDHFALAQVRCWELGPLLSKPIHMSMQLPRLGLIPGKQFWLHQLRKIISPLVRPQTRI